MLLTIIILCTQDIKFVAIVKSIPLLASGRRPSGGDATESWDIGKIQLTRKKHLTKQSDAKKLCKDTFICSKEVVENLAAWNKINSGTPSNFNSNYASQLQSTCITFIGEYYGKQTEESKKQKSMKQTKILKYIYKLIILSTNAKTRSLKSRIIQNKKDSTYAVYNTVWLFKNAINIIDYTPGINPHM